MAAAVAGAANLCTDNFAAIFVANSCAILYTAPGIPHGSTWSPHILRRSTRTPQHSTQIHVESAHSVCDGDRQKGKGFINTCQVYFRLRPDQFPDEQTKIQWAMTYMNQGRAQKWANCIYHWEAVPANIGNPHLVDWDDFRSRFRTEFFPLHSDAVATNKLEGTSYIQGRRMVDDYLDDFRDLISDSSYADPKTIVVKFRRGLNPSIVDAVATMASGRPGDLDPEAWFEAAIRFDQNQAANAAF
jgi:hypothetical protein